MVKGNSKQGTPSKNDRISLTRVEPFLRSLRFKVGKSKLYVDKDAGLIPLSADGLLTA